MTEPRGKRSILVIALALSIALNLFLGGVLAGRLTGQVTQGLQMKRNLDELLAPVPEHGRTVVRRELRQAMPDIRREMQQMQQARAAVAEELSRTQFDAAALDRHFDEIRVHTSAMQSTLQQAIKRAAADLTPEERRALVEALKKRQSRFGAP